MLGAWWFEYQRECERILAPEDPTVPLEPLPATQIMEPVR